MAKGPRLLMKSKFECCLGRVTDATGPRLPFNSFLEFQGISRAHIDTFFEPLFESLSQGPWDPQGPITLFLESLGIPRSSEEVVNLQTSRELA